MIRLNRAWQLHWLPAEQAFDIAALPTIAERAQADRIDLPTELAVPSSETRQLWLSRRFNRPSNLLASQVVHLQIRPASLVGSLLLNQTNVSGCVEEETIVFEIGNHLQRYNRLDMRIASLEDMANADVQLQIHEPS